MNEATFPELGSLFANYPYLALLASVLILSYYARKFDVFQPLYGFIAGKVKSKRAVVALTSAVSGVLPIEGRVTVSAAVLSTMAPENEKRKKYGVLDYLATHHFYFWSPIEKTVIVPMAALGISYGALLGLVWPMLATMVIATLWYIFGVLKEDDVDIVIRGSREKQDLNWRKELRKGSGTVFIVAIILLIAEFAKFYAEQLGGLVEKAQSSGWTIAVLLALAIGSFIMGSSGKYSGLLAIVLPVYGASYLPLLFTAAWAGYMLSPTHKCMIIGQRMFGSKLSDYYKVVSAVVGLVFLVSVVFTLGITL